MGDARYDTFMGRGPDRVVHWEHWSNPDAETYLTGFAIVTGAGSGIGAATDRRQLEPVRKGCAKRNPIVERLSQPPECASFWQKTGRISRTVVPPPGLAAEPAPHRRHGMPPHDKTKPFLDKVLLALCLAVGLALPTAGARDWGVSKPVPPHEAFWEAPAAWIPGTVLLWPFDEQAEKGDAEIEALFDEAVAAAPAGGPPDGLPAGRRSVPFERLGDAVLTPAGVFGGGLRLGGQGWVKSGPAGLRDLLRAEPYCFTLAFWLRPAAGSPPDGQCLLALASADGTSSLRLVRDGTGGVALLVDGRPALVHPRQVPANQWTHLALTLRQQVYRGGGTLALLEKGEAILRVNGAEARLGEEWQAPLAALCRSVDGRFVLGAEADGTQGFAGELDDVRLAAGEPWFYAWQDWGFLDPEGKRAVVRGYPWFVSDRPEYLLCTFDQGLRPERFRGLEATGADRPGLRVPGVRGSALDLSRIDEAGLAVVGLEALPQERGTIEFWFRPKDWNNFFHGDYIGSDVRRFLLLRLAAKQDTHPSYAGLRAVWIEQGRNHQHFWANTPWVPFHPGKWTHAVLTWEGEKTAVYLDGSPQEQTQLSLTTRPTGHLADAFTRWQEQSAGQDDGTYRLTFLKSNTLVDELRVYDWPFRPEEAWNAYAGFLPQGERQFRPLPPLEAAFDYFAHCWEMAPRLEVTVTCLPVEGVRPKSVSLRLQDEGGSLIQETPATALSDEGKAMIAIRRELPFGRYPLLLASHGEDGQELARLETEYHREQPAWYANQLGKQRTVPPPWTPIRVQDRVVELLGRTVELQAGGLPAAIVSQGLPLLATPVVVRWRQGDRWEDAAAIGELRFGEPAPDRVAWQGTMAAGAANLAVEAWMEFDGLISYRLTLAPVAGGSPLEVDELQVDFAFPDNTVSQLIANSGAFQFRQAYDVRLIPAGEGPVWNSLDSKPAMVRGVEVGNFLANLWLGGDRVGLNFSAENDQGWTPDDQRPAHEILRRPGQVVYRMNVITQPVAVDPAGRSFGFLLLPTPAKPEPPGWRAWGRVAPGQPRAHIGIVDQFSGYKLTDTPTRQAPGITFTLEPASWEDAAAQAARLRQAMAHQMLPADPLFFYIDASWPTLGPSMKDWNRDLWAGTGRIAWIPEVEDYYVWIINEYLRRDLIQGLYIDDASMGRTFSLASTAYPFPGSERGRRVGYNTMGFRRFLMRVYRLFVEHGKTPHILPHMTWCFELPAFSFVDATLNGEDRDIKAYAERDSVDVWSPEELRIMGNAPKWGFATLFKGNVYPELQPKQKAVADNWAHRQFRAQFAIFVPHDLWTMFAETRLIHPAFLDFGMDAPDLEFLPYWAIDGQFDLDAAAPDKLLAGLFRKADTALLMVSNLADTDQEVTVKVRPERLFGRAGALALRDADPSLPIPHWEYRNMDQQATAEAGKMGGATAAGLLADGAPEVDEPLAALDQLEEAGADRRREEQRLAMTFAADTATFVVRRHDYRILAISLAGD